ncbi:asparaginase [Actibacterium sp. MT2.3-13A]|uniref:asparaginase n=1 Tax=Actibacterium sp. MT2.3-13A TaxID=2828332 RepID=UPI001BA52916|nr:asparaginase [Actibacterium sp. MT2.3-13A]
MTSDASLLPRIAVIGCGGTISTLSSGPFDYLDYPESGTKLSAEEVIAHMPQLGVLARLEPLPFREIGSSKMAPQDWCELTATITQALAEDPELAGVVVLHGTATLEETAYFLDLTLDTDRPVVVVGAQRPLHTVGSDAIANAAAAVRVAAAAQSRGRGVLVVLNDEIHAARDVTKGSTYRVHAFASGVYGPLGVVDADRVVFMRRSERRRPRGLFAVSADTALPRVDVLYACAGVDGTFVRASLAAGARGLVSAGFAPGMTAPREREALNVAARQGVAIVQCSRVGAGRVARRQVLRRDGWIAGDDLTPQKARVLLMLGLTKTSDPETLQRYFEDY